MQRPFFTVAGLIADKGVLMDTESTVQSTDTNSTPAPTYTQAPESAPSERTFRQSELNEIVGKVRQEARNEGIENYKKSQQQSQQSQQSSYSQQPQQQSSNYHESDYRRIASEEAQRLRDEWVNDARSKSDTDNAQRIVKSFWDKVEAGKEKYEDFEKITGNIELARFPNVVQLLAEHIDNSHDVLYELGKNRLKMSQLEQLSNMSPRDAVIEVQRLAESIKNNESTSNYKSPREPLSQQRPANAGTGYSGGLSMSDLKRKYRG